MNFSSFSLSLSLLWKHENVSKSLKVLLEKVIIHKKKVDRKKKKKEEKKRKRERLIFRIQYFIRCFFATSRIFLRISSPEYSAEFAAINHFSSSHFLFFFSALFLVSSLPFLTAVKMMSDEERKDRLMIIITIWIINYHRTPYSLFFTFSPFILYRIFSLLLFRIFYHPLFIIWILVTNWIQFIRWWKRIL